MKVKLEDKVEHYRTVWMEGSVVRMIDQPKLPHSFEILDLRLYKDTAIAIRNMNTRGAGAIGATAGYAMAQVVIEATYRPELRHITMDQYPAFLKYVEQGADYIKSMRPTAQNLFYAVDKVLAAVKSTNNLIAAVDTAQKTAQAIADEDADNCKLIGEHGEKIIQDGYRILTHCNAGCLAFVDYGSALSPIYVANEKGKKVMVYADETRPRLQGARLTAWELGQQGIDHKIIADNVSGWLMQLGKVDMVIVGSDRIAANGDVANKIGTYEKAVVAKENGIPFYVAAPTSTIDMDSPSGKYIPIEERDEDEVLLVNGFCDATGKMEKVRISPKDSHALNLAFDVTPAKYVSGIITEKGIVKPNKKSIAKLFK